MNWLVRALSSSIGKKFVMGITGLLLCGFLIVHLAGNLLLFVGPDAYNHYAHSLHSQEALLMVAEVGLFLLFIAHVILAVATGKQNLAARKVDYTTKESKQNPILMFFPHNWMWVTGAIVLAFILLHLWDFKLDRLGTDINAPIEEEPFDKAVRVLKHPLTFGGYLVGVFFLGLHLSHGFASAFQSLGLNHPKYNKAIKIVGGLFAITIALGFASFPFWAVFLRP